MVAASSGAVCDGLPLSRYMLAGAVAGMVEHVAMFPVDTIKTRMQVTPPHPSVVVTPCARAGSPGQLSQTKFEN